MFVRRLVSGVRSSCEASETSCRCERAESSSAPSIVLNVAASRESSSLPCASIRCERSPVSETSSAARVSRCTGASTARATRSPSPAASAMPTSAMAISQRLIGPRMLSTSSSERATWTAKPLAERDRQHADVRPLDVRVLVERLVDLAACGCESARRDRELAGRSGGVITSPSRAHELGEDGDAAEPLGRQPEELLAARAADDLEVRGARARATAASRRRRRAARSARSRT